MSDQKAAVPLFDLTRQWQDIRKDVHEALNRVFATQHFIMGPEVSSLEQECAAYLKVKRAVGVSSGTDALLAALMVLDVGPGDEVVTEPPAQKIINKKATFSGLDKITGRIINFDEDIGETIQAALLFADLRGFTPLSESNPPAAVIAALGAWFDRIAGAVHAFGGEVLKFIGDGVMALFGIESDARAASRAALDAARLMSERLEELNRSLQGELDQPLRIGIGIHIGPTIVGEMGYGSAVAITAIGDAVNTASRLETLTKTYSCQLVVSEEIVSRAGLDLSAFPRYEIEIRGKREMLAVRTVASASELSAAGGISLAPVEPAVI